MRKGVVLAGGLGTRLAPFTEWGNKHLLPCWDRPVVAYPMDTLVRAGIDDIAVVIGGRGLDGFRYLRNGEAWGLRRLTYLYQEREGGISQAISLAEAFVGGRDEKFAVILGDNVFLDSDEQLRLAASDFAGGAKIFLKRVPDPERFGVPAFAGEPGASPIVRLDEKPRVAPSPFAVCGFYLLDGRCFDMIRASRPSARNELEIVDVLNAYLAKGDLVHEVLGGAWLDAGTPDSLLAAANAVAARSRAAAASGAAPIERAMPAGVR